ncbi:MAG: S41 family peptidase [Bacteroidota bacterium]
MMNLFKIFFSTSVKGSLLFIGIFALEVEAQEQMSTALPVLTKEEMLADFDTYVESVKRFSPQTPVRKALTGIDPLSELKKIRQRIATVTSTEAYAKLIKSAITVLQDGHSSLLWPQAYSPEYLKKLGISDRAIALFPSYYELRATASKKKKFRITLKYIDGQYYNVIPFEHNGTSYTSGLQLTEINNTKAPIFIGQLYPYLRKMRWDYAYERYYSETFYHAFNLSSDQSLHLKFVDTAGAEIEGVFPLNQALQFEDVATKAQQNQRYKVDYFPEDQVLYVRIPAMNLEYLDFYPEEIVAKSSGKPLKKVIIDIRGNRGGADNVWLNALEAIIDRPIHFEMLLLANPTEELKRKYPNEELSEWKSYRASFLDNYEYKIFASGPRQIKPSSSSIRFTGTIYILQDDAIYSSAGALAAIGQLDGRIFTVGERTGWLLGRGINPLVFELPHSKILYRIEPVIDFQNVENTKDVYHDHVEIPVSFSIEQYLHRINYDGDIYGKDFLFNHDPVFLKALKD